MEEKSTNVDFAERLFARARDLQAEGVKFSLAVRQADLENRIANWPASWGDRLQVVIYGDFQPPSADIDVPEGIVVHKDSIKKAAVSPSALCHLRGTVATRERSIRGVIEASEKLNTFLGIWCLTQWGNIACGWWSHITHGGSGGILAAFDKEIMQIAPAMNALSVLPSRVRSHVCAALYWIYAQRSGFREPASHDVLRVYVGYWNAFECLVTAVNLLKPPRKPNATEKQAAIDQMLRQSGKVTPEFVQRCYTEVVRPGLRADASHALTTCFGDEARRYIAECFATDESLYRVRNAISHGTVNVQDPLELTRIEMKLSRLWMITWRMFNRLLPFGGPLDPEAEDTGR